MSSALLIQQFPFPPTINKAYANIQGVGRVATKELREYKNHCMWWATKHKQSINTFKYLCQEEWSGVKVFQVEAFFVCKPETIWTKKSEPKSFDVSNRIKCFEDQLCHYLGIDDKCIWSITATKLIGENENVFALIGPHEACSAVEVLTSLNNSETTKKVVQ